VDAFTDRFLDGTELDGTTMQSIARELNVSETVFVLPSREARYLGRLRIFTPGQELTFAGHPTIGTAFVLFTIEIVPSDVDHFVLEEEIGPVPVTVQKTQTAVDLADYSPD